jgi:hypothetical protein
MPSDVDRRRLRDGKRALDASAWQPASLDEVHRQIRVVHDGIAALQSLDDLGEEGNAQASQDLQVLWHRHSGLEQQREELEAAARTWPTDPTTAAITDQVAAWDRLRAEVVRLESALAAAHRLASLADVMFVEGYDQAVREICDHFVKQQRPEIATQIAQIWNQVAS